MSWGSRDIPVTLPSSAPRKAARLTIQATSQPLPGMRARPDLGDGLLHRVNFGPVDHNEVFSTTATRVICCRQGSRSRDGMAQRFVPLVDGVAPQNRTADPVYRLGRGSDPGDNRVCGTVPMSPSCAGLQELRLLAWRQDGGLGSSPPERVGLGGCSGPPSCLCVCISYQPRSETALARTRTPSGCFRGTGARATGHSRETLLRR